MDQIASFPVAWEKSPWNIILLGPDTVLLRRR